MDLSLLTQYLHPYWEGDKIFRESVLFARSQSGSPLPASLLYPATQIYSVESADLTIQYTEGLDYQFSQGKLLWQEGSSIPCQTYEKLYPLSPIPEHSFPRTNGGNLYFSEGAVFHGMQTLVTYSHTAFWEGPIPLDKSSLLPNTQKLLHSAKAPKILFMGDSITEGANSSGPVGVSPHLGSWWQLAMDFLEMKYKKNIPHNRVAMGGQISAWGVQQAPHAAREYSPDLVVIAFGMNDGTHKVPPRQFRTNIQSIMETFLKLKPETEFILVGSILPNPEARDFVGYQKENRDMLLELEGNGTAVCDVTAMHQAFLLKKTYQDITGNNVNHLNDFSARLQAQVLLRTIGAL